MLVFSSQSPTYVLCDSQSYTEFPAACIDYESSVCVVTPTQGTNIKEGEAFTWLIGVALMLIAAVNAQAGLLAASASFRPAHSQDRVSSLICLRPVINASEGSDR